MLKLKQSIFIFIFLSYFLGTSQEGTLYFDKDWKQTTKENAEFYRPTPEKVKNLWLFKDYYINGDLQFIGHSTDAVKEIWEGDITWYFHNGRVEQKYRYLNGNYVGSFVAKNDADKSEKGYLEEEMYYYDYENVEIEDIEIVEDYKEEDEEEEFIPEDPNAKYIKKSHKYYGYTRDIAVEYLSYYGYENKVNTKTYYDLDGNVIGRMELDAKNKKYNGTEIIFEENYNAKYTKPIKIITYVDGEKVSEKDWSEK